MLQQQMLQRWKKILTLTLAFVLSSFLLLPPSPAAANPIGDFFRGIQTVFKPPRGSTPVGRSRGGGGRGPLCPAFLATSIKALVPSLEGSEGSTSELVWGRTTQANPTLWFYVPYAADRLKFAKLVVLDENKQLLPQYPLRISLVETPGIISVQLPDPLEINKLYSWYFSVICSTEKPSRNPSIRGWIERAEPIAGNTYEDYAKNGIGYDMVTDLVSQYKRQPEQYIQDWLQLLESLDAKDLNDVPIIPCCTTTNSQSTHTSPNIADVHTGDLLKATFERVVMPSLW